MKRFSLCVAAALLAVTVVATPMQAVAAQRYEPDASGSEVIVEGTSTMHGWEAKGSVIHGHLVLNEADLASLWSKVPSTQRIAPATEVEIPVESLKSGKSAMDQKMHEALKAQSNPVITYRLESAKTPPDPNAREAGTEEGVSVETTGILMVAGKGRTVEIPMRLRRFAESAKLEVSGETTLRMTDFDIHPPKAMLGALRTGDEIRVRWKWLLTPLQAIAEHAVRQAPLPVKADQLMPLKYTEGIYLVKEGPEKGRLIPFTLEQRADRWILTKRGLTWHELRRDDQGNILILREADLLKNKEVEYNPPVVLLPAVVDSNTSVSGKSRVTIKNAKSGSVTYRGDCEWHLTFLGIESLEAADETVPIYHLQMTHRIHLPLDRTSATIDFGYALGKGMVATAVEQTNRLFGIFKDRTIWRLEQILARASSIPERHLCREWTYPWQSWYATIRRLSGNRLVRSTEG